MEAVLLSISPSYVNRQVMDNPKLGNYLQEMKKDIDKPLSAILTLNTIAHTVGAIGVGAQAANVFGETPFKIPLINMEMSYESLIAGLMTLAILILSEIIPKTLGATYWKKYTPLTVTFLKIIMFVLYPFVWLSKVITKFMKSSDVHSVFSRDDYIAMTNLGGKSGVLEASEETIINNLLDLNRIKIIDVMTPRSVLHAVDETTTIEAYYNEFKDGPFSRIPIFKGELDKLSGFVLKTDIMRGLIDGSKEAELSSIKRKIAHVTETTSIKDFFKSMNEQNEHIAAVADEFGMITGLVSLEDVLETILGFEIVDEMDQIDDLQAYARQKWEERASKIGLIK